MKRSTECHIVLYVFPSTFIVKLLCVLHAVRKISRGICGLISYFCRLTSQPTLHFSGVFECCCFVVVPPRPPPSFTSYCCQISSHLASSEWNPDLLHLGNSFILCSAEYKSSCKRCLACLLSGFSFHEGKTIDQEV